MKYNFVCLNCNKTIKPNPNISTCPEPNCEGAFEIVYTNTNTKSPQETLIPLSNILNLTYLGQGNTPIVRLNTLSDNFGINNIYAKLEYMNPTGSFKDRGSAMMISALSEFGINEIVEDSSGNAGASISAYSAYSKIKSHIFVPENAPKNKVSQIQLYGSIVHKIPGPRDNSTIAAIKYSEENSIAYSSHNLSPFFIEGTKSFGHEIIKHFNDKQPDHILFPVGNGSLLIGSYKAYEEIKKINPNIKIPKHHGIQTESISPIIEIFSNNKWYPEQAKSTIANGIAILNPPRKYQSVNVIKKTNGKGIKVSDESILKWQKELARKDGIFAEITSAAVLSGLDELIKQKIILSDENVLLPITGFGLKDPPKDLFN